METARSGRRPSRSTRNRQHRPSQSSSNTVKTKYTAEPFGATGAAQDTGSAAIMAAAPPFWSAAPRPCTRPSFTRPEYGSSSHCAGSPMPTVSTCASKAIVRGPEPMRAMTLPRPSNRTSSQPASRHMPAIARQTASSRPLGEGIFTSADSVTAEKSRSACGAVHHGAGDVGHVTLEYGTIAAIPQAEGVDETQGHRQGLAAARAGRAGSPPASRPVRRSTAPASTSTNGIRVGNLEPDERITRILKHHLETRHGVPFVTDRWGRGVYWQWICWVPRPNRAAKPLSHDANWCSAKLYITVDRKSMSFEAGMTVERGYVAGPDARKPWGLKDGLGLAPARRAVPEGERARRRDRAPREARGIRRGDSRRRRHDPVRCPVLDIRAEGAQRGGEVPGPGMGGLQPVLPDARGGGPRHHGPGAGEGHTRACSRSSCRR